MQSLPHFQFTHTSITNHITKNPYQIYRMIDLQPSEQFLDSIVHVCNEQKIYDWLFRARLKGKAYPRSDAEWFYQWGCDGWRNNTHFLFLILDQQGLAAAACDIKTADLEAAEIGYWSSIHHRGIMTNGVQVMVQAGFQAGFRQLYAKVRLANHQSASVLKRLGFISCAQWADHEFDAFHLVNQ